MWTQRETNVQYAHGKNVHANNKASCCFCTHCCKSNSAIAFVSCMLRSMHNNTLKTGTMNRAYHDCLTGKGIGTPLCDCMWLYAGHELYCCPYLMHICCSQCPIFNCIFHYTQDLGITKTDVYAGCVRNLLKSHQHIAQATEAVWQQDHMPPTYRKGWKIASEIPLAT